MLRIRKEYDLKNLERFGFTFLNKVDHPQKKYCYYISATVNQNGIMIYDDRIIRNVGAESCVLRETNDIIYDLINTYIEIDNKQVSIVERVDE